MIPGSILPQLARSPLAAHPESITQTQVTNVIMQMAQDAHENKLEKTLLEIRYMTLLMSAVTSMPAIVVLMITGLTTRHTTAKA